MNKNPHKIIQKSISFPLGGLKKLKGKDIYIYINETYSKETLEIRKENWQTVNRLRSQGTYACLLYDPIPTKAKFRKHQNE